VCALLVGDETRILSVRDTGSSAVAESTPPAGLADSDASTFTTQ
jgi:hypothetical protein